MAVKAKEFISSLTNGINTVVTTYYEEAATKSVFPYAVLNGLHINDNLADFNNGDIINFYLDVWIDETKPTATEDLEGLCDKLRNELSGAVVSMEGAFYAHLAFENQSPSVEKEYDISHRRLALSARIYYY